MSKAKENYQEKKERLIKELSNLYSQKGTQIITKHERCFFSYNLTLTHLEKTERESFVRLIQLDYERVMISKTSDAESKLNEHLKLER